MPFKYAVRIYHIFNPLEGVSLPKKKKSEITLLDDSEQEKLQQYIAENPSHTIMGVALSMSTGIRIGELCALQWKDIDLEKRILTVRKTMQRIQCPTDTAKTKLIITEPKSETSCRSIPIPDCMMNLLQNFRGKRDNFVLSGTEKPVEPRVMQYRFQKILKNAKLPSVHFHALRHIFASNCIKWGFDVKALSELLGHSNVEITLAEQVKAVLTKDLFSDGRKNHILDYSDFMKKANSIPEVTPYFEKDSIAAIIGTSGTTGTPKGVCLTNENMNAMALQHKYGEMNFAQGDKLLDVLMIFIGYGIATAHYSGVLGFEVIMIPDMHTDIYPYLAIFT